MKYYTYYCVLHLLEKMECEDQSIIGREPFKNSNGGITEWAASF